MEMDDKSSKKQSREVYVVMSESSPSRRFDPYEPPTRPLEFKIDYEVVCTVL